MRGRYPAGPEYVEHLDASSLAKERLQVVLETLAGTCRVQEACARLGVGEVRFHQLRLQALQAAAERLETRPGGRPRQVVTQEAEQVEALQERMAELEVELRAAQVREELALVLPHVVQEADEPEKKRTRRPPPK
jgi:hypothetical protein